MSNTSDLPTSIQRLAVAVSAGSSVLIAPLSSVSLNLLALTPDESQNVRLLTLVARGEPVFCALLLALANGAEFVPQPPVTSVEAAIRRIGPQQAHTALLACAPTPAVASTPAGMNLSNAMSRHALTSATTARNLSHWAGLSQRDAALLYLGALMHPVALYCGLAHDRAIADPLRQCLQSVVDSGDIAWSSSPGLAGFGRVSALIVRKWGVGHGVADSLDDCATGSPTSHAGKRLRAVQRLLEHKQAGHDEAQALTGMESALGPLAPNAPAQGLRLVTGY